jgi:hypothetical protein
LVGQLDKAFFASGRRNDCKSLSGQFEGGFAPDATACSGYHCGFFLL